jgi:acid phosphatase type 7
LKDGHTARVKRALCGRPVRVVLLATLLGVGLLSAVTLAAPAATSVTFTPTDDTFSSSSDPSANYGSLSYVRVDASPTRRAFLRFNVTGLTGPVTRATLRLYSRTRHSTGFDVRGVSNTGWAERTLTHANAPSPSATSAAASGRLSSRAWTAIDVTGLVTGNGNVAFALTTTSRTNLELATKEGGSSTSPQLIVEAATPSSGSTAPSTAPTTTTAPPPTTTTTTTTSPPPSGNDPVIAIAGDIAGDGSGDSATAALLDSLNPTAVLTAGDNAYNDGSAAQYNSYYEPTWGRHKAKTYPTPGNHEYHTSGASGYFGYFGTRAGTAGQGWYSYDVGAWHLIALNSEVSHGSTSAQVTWLKDDLARTSAKCVLAYWHKPRFTAGNYSDMSEFQPFWDALYAANADVVINGHDHNYQRYAPMTPAGVRDDARGVREFVVGTGGRSHYGIRADSRREAGDASTYGVLKLTLRPSSYEWRFVPETGRSYTDSGTGNCH